MHMEKAYHAKPVVATYINIIELAIYDYNN